MPKKHKEYSLLSAIAMIVGICIGSGIFFKSDNILIATNGNIAIGIILFIIAAMAIIFGSLTIGMLAQMTDQPGGIIAYAHEFVNRRFACGLGWFMTLVYYPTITIVVSWVVGVYVNILFHLQFELEGQMIIGFAFMSLCYLYNVIAPRLGAFIQQGTTFIKLIPLFALGVAGILFGDPVAGIMDFQPELLASAGFLTALGPIAYCFDGWIVSTSIAHEIKESKKNLPKALTIAPLIILFIYILYFFGISCFVGPDSVMSLQDEHVQVAAMQIFGPTFAKMIMVFVIISVIGTVNGLVTGFIRMPYLMSLRKGMFFLEKYHTKTHSRFHIPIGSAISAYIISFIWMIIHYIMTRFGLLGNSDVSEIAITMSYLFYVVLYLKVIVMYKNGEIKSFIKGIIFPICAILGSLIILTGALQTPMFIYYVLFVALIYAFSQFYYRKNML